MHRLTGPGSLLVPSLAGAGLALLVAGTTPQISPITADSTGTPSSAWLGLLPDGEVKRQFIIDCTGCHQFDRERVMKDGRPRTATEWSEAIGRMLGFSGPGSSFPVISSAQTPESTAAWLVRHLPPNVAGPTGSRAAPSDRCGNTSFRRRRSFLMT